MARKQPYVALMVRLAPALVARLKRQAARRGMTLTVAVTRALQAYLRARRKPRG